MITLRESPDCDCRIELTKVISLSDNLHPGLFAYSPLVMRDSRGFWYATSNTDGLKQVGVFDQEGRLTKVIGGPGEGPGEFKFINHIVVGSGDTLYVYDHAQLRRSVFDPDHELASEGVLWVAPRNAYELANYSVVGPKFEPTNRVYRRQAEWFQPWTERSPDGRPRPSIMQIAFGPEDPTLLWVAISVADAEWAPRRPQRSSKELIDSQYDSILEVIDVKSGAVLATRRFGPTLSRLTFQGLIPAVRIDDANNVWMDIFTPTLHRR